MNPIRIFEPFITGFMRDHQFARQWPQFAYQVDGVLDVFTVEGPKMGEPYFVLASGVAVVATSTWAAMQGVAALDIEWQDSPEPLDNDRAGVEMFAEMIREMRQEKGAEISDKCMKDIENAPNPQAAFVRAAVDIQPG